MTTTTPRINDCLDWIRGYSSSVSWVELERWAERQGMTVEGDLELTRRPNLVLWEGVSQDYAVFLNPAAVLRVAGSALVETHDEWQASRRRYVCEGPMALLDETAMFSTTC